MVTVIRKKKTKRELEEEERRRKRLKEAEESKARGRRTGVGKAPIKKEDAPLLFQDREATQQPLTEKEQRDATQLEVLKQRVERIGGEEALKRTPDKFKGEISEFIKSEEKKKDEARQEEVRKRIKQTEAENIVFKEEEAKAELPTGAALPEIPEDVGKLREDIPIDISESKSLFVTLMTQRFPETSRVLGINIAADIQNKLAKNEITRGQANKEYLQRGLVQLGDLFDTGIDQISIKALGGENSVPRQVEDAVSNFDKTLTVLKELVQGMRDTGSPDLMDEAVKELNKAIIELDDVAAQWHGEAQFNPVFARDNGLQVQADLDDRATQLVIIRDRLIGAQDSANRRLLGLPRGLPEV